MNFMGIFDHTTIHRRPVSPVFSQGCVDGASWQRTRTATSSGLLYPNPAR
jgi:hypothetical protein